MVKVTKIYHSCFVIECGGTKIVTDPYVYSKAQAQKIYDADIVLVSHAHGDHLSGLDYINKKALVITNYELSVILEKQGFRTTGMNFGGECTFNFGDNLFKICMVKAEHTSGYSSKEGFLCGGNACGFIIKTPSTSFYFMGDTDMFLDMKLITDYHKPDVIMMPVGDTYTMGINKALYAVNNLLSAKHIIPMHYRLISNDSADSVLGVKQSEFDYFKQNSRIDVILLNDLQEISL